MEGMLIALRATYDRLGLDGLERLTRDADQLDAVIGRLNADHPEQPLIGWVAIATCNRLEIYLDAERFHDAVDLVVEAVTHTSGLHHDAVADALIADAGRSSARHLFSVTSGLDSQVLGEAEITGQVRAGFSAALAAGQTTSLLNDLFQGAARTAKKVTTSTRVGAAGRSSVAVALDAAEELVDSLRNRDALIIGTGAMARVASAELHRRSIARLRVFSPSGRAPGFADTHNAIAVSEADLADAVTQSAVIVAASGGGSVVLHPGNVHPAGDLVILDLALHSDVDPAVAEDTHVHLLGLGDISAGTGETDEMERARGLVDAGVIRFEERQRIRAMDPAVSALRASVREEVASEVERVRAAEGDAVAAIVDRSLHRVYNRLLHSPMARAQELARTGNGEKFLHAVHTIFGVDVSEQLSLGEPGSAPTADELAQPPMTVAEMSRAMQEVDTRVR